ncbi:hypothetical protein MJD09_05440 [bacterium]|nr:hypothetical protein [bacterium]
MLSKALVMLLFINLKLAFSQSLNPQLDENSVADWQRFVIRSSGTSAISLEGNSGSERIEALERAKMSAEENLFMAAQLLPFSADVTVGQAFSESLSDLRQIIRRFTIVDTRSMSDMTVEVDVELPVMGDLLTLLLPKDLSTGQWLLGSDPLCPTCGQPWPKGKPVPQGVTLIVPSDGYLTVKGTPFTGLIVDARDLEIEPVLVAKIVNEDDVEIYGLNYLTREAVVASGMVAYQSDLEQAKQSSRVGPDPLVVRALRGAGNRKANLVISNSDAVLIHAACKIQDFLRECKVIIVI